MIVYFVELYCSNLMLIWKESKISKEEFSLCWCSFNARLRLTHCNHANISNLWQVIIIIRLYQAYAPDARRLKQQCFTVFVSESKIKILWELQWYVRTCIFSCCAIVISSKEMLSNSFVLFYTSIFLYTRSLLQNMQTTTHIYLWFSKLLVLIVFQLYDLLPTHNSHQKCSLLFLLFTFLCF